MLRCVALARATQRNIPEDAALHSHRRENLKAYTWFVFKQIVISSYSENIP
jgi:hypothetical protein